MTHLSSVALLAICLCITLASAQTVLTCAPGSDTKYEGRVDLSGGSARIGGQFTSDGLATVAVQPSGCDVLLYFGDWTLSSQGVSNTSFSVSLLQCSYQGAADTTCDCTSAVGTQLLGNYEAALDCTQDPHVVDFGNGVFSTTLTPYSSAASLFVSAAAMLVALLAFLM